MIKLAADKIMELVRDDYDKQAHTFARSRDRMWSELRFLFDYSRKGDKVLDLGCGNGRFSQYLRESEYTGVDFSKNLIEEAEERFPSKLFKVGSALQIPFEEKTFDKVYSIAMIHQVPGKDNRIKALQDIKRVLKINGFAFLTVWNIKKNDKAFKNYSFRYIHCEDDLKQMTLIEKIKDFLTPRNFFLKGNRYYYIFKRGELTYLSQLAGLTVVEEGIIESDGRSNLYVILKRE